MTPRREEKPLSSEYSVRRLDHGIVSDRQCALQILREYFADDAEIDADARYEWLYLDNPAGRARTYVACVGETPVGITSLFPRHVLVAGKSYVGAIGGDGYVTPAHRRRGIVTALHRAAHDDMDGGLSFMFGPPEPNNLKALLHAGAKITGSVRRYTRALSVRGFGRKAEALPFMHSLDWLFHAGRTTLKVERLGGIADARVEAVWRSMRREMDLRTHVVPVADATFYAWRFGRSPSGQQYSVIVEDGGTPIGAAALEDRDGRAAILDITCDPAEFRRVVKALLASVAHVDQVSIQIHLPQVTKELALHSLGFLPRETKPFQVQAKAGHAAFDTLTNEHAWNYMWGDGDLERLLEGAR